MSGPRKGSQRGGGSGGSLPRADSHGAGMSLGQRAATGASGAGSRPATGGFAGALTTPGELLTANRHHILGGVDWRLDTAGAPKALPNRPKRFIVAGASLSHL